MDRVLVRRHLPGFVARLEEAGHALPEFVKKELEGFAGCGDYAEPGIMRSTSSGTSQIRILRADALPVAPHNSVKVADLVVVGAAVGRKSARSER